MERPVVLRPLLLASPPWPASLRPVLRCPGIRTPRNSGSLRFKRHRQRICQQFNIFCKQGRKDLIHNEKRSIVRERDKSDFFILTRKLCQQFQKKQHIIFDNAQRNFRKGNILCFKTSDIVFVSIGRNGNCLRFKKDNTCNVKTIISLTQHCHIRKDICNIFKKHGIQQAGNVCKQLIFFKFFKQKHRLQQTFHKQFFKKHSHLQPSFFELQEFFFKFLKQQFIFFELQKQFILFKQLQQKQFVEQFLLPQQFFLLIGKLPQFGIVLQRRQQIFRRKFIVLKFKKALMADEAF